jgi:uncharacterized protein YjgD (DUF1641 family)
VIFASTPEAVRSLSNPWILVKNAGLLIANLVTFQLGEVFTSMKRLATSPSLLGFLIGGFLVSYLLALFTDRRMSAVFSQFWHKEQPNLRDALKRARESAGKGRLQGKQGIP